MALLVTPGQLNKRSDFYHQLASLTAAGLPIVQALESIERNAPGPSYVRPLRAVLDFLHHGSTLSEAFARLGNWIPQFDQALFEAGERSGRLDSCFRLLANYYKEQAQLVSRTMSDLLYPFFIVHLAILIFPTTLLSAMVWQGQVTPYLTQKLKIIVPLYLALYLLVLATNSTRTNAWRGLMERFFGPVPFLGKGRRNLALARLCAALEALISAGVSIVDAWPMAAQSSGSVALIRAVHRMEPKVATGTTPAEALRSETVFPELFRSMYNSGEISGQLDTTLKRLHAHYSEEASRKLQNFSQWAPRAILLLIFMGVGYYVVSFWKNYYDNILNMNF
jgi:type II secretory pathway component PulF